MSRLNNNRRKTLRVERLESRQMMSVNPYGGQILPHVEVQAMYLGSDWSTNASEHRTTGNVEGFLNTIVNSPYMDMLTRAGYGVGRGSFSTGTIDRLNINKSQWLSDSTIRQQIQTYVSAGYLNTPDNNRLFVVYVEPGVAIWNNNGGGTSQTDFLGYHGAFAGSDRYGRANTIHYAVIAYPGGYNFTSQRDGFSSDFAQLTSVTSHELSEAVTDANVGYSTPGWYDPHWFDPATGKYEGAEIGDICNGQTFNLYGYTVQKESDRFDRAMTTSGVGSSGVFASSIASASLSGASNGFSQQIVSGAIGGQSSIAYDTTSANLSQSDAHSLLFAENLFGRLGSRTSLEVAVSNLAAISTSPKAGLLAGAVDHLFSLTEELG